MKKDRPVATVTRPFLDLISYLYSTDLLIGKESFWVLLADELESNLPPQLSHYTLCRRLCYLMSPFGSCHFLWGGTSDHTRNHLVSLAGKRFVDLGQMVVSAWEWLETLNLAWLAKVGWHLHARNDSLWSKVLKGKYMPGTDSFMQARTSGQCSSTWRGIVQTRPRWSKMEHRWWISCQLLEWLVGWCWTSEKVLKRLCH